MEETLTLEKNGDKDGNVMKDVMKELSERQLLILEMIDEDSFVTIPEMSLKTGVATRTIGRDIETLQTLGVLRRKGGRKNGKWEIITRPGMTASCPTTQTVMPDLIGHLTDHDF